jgi:hypothetical protein
MYGFISRGLPDRGLKAPGLRHLLRPRVLTVSSGMNNVARRIERYEELCKRYGEEPQHRVALVTTIPDYEGSHARWLEERARRDALVVLVMES